MNIIHSFHPEVKRRRRATGPTARRGKTAEEGERHAAEQRRLRQRKGIAKAVSSYAALHSRLLGWGKGRRGSLARLARAIELDGFADVPFPVAAVDVNSMVAAGKRRGGGWTTMRGEENRLTEKLTTPDDVPDGVRNAASQLLTNVNILQGLTPGQGRRRRLLVSQGFSLLHSLPGGSAQSSTGTVPRCS